MGPVWWQNQIKTQLTYNLEARGFMEQFFNSLMQFLKPQQTEVTNGSTTLTPATTTHWASSAGTKP